MPCNNDRCVEYDTSDPDGGNCSLIERPTESDCEEYIEDTTSPTPLGQVDFLVKCADCGTETSKPYDNGDGKDRCGDCAVILYRRFSMTMAWPTHKVLSNCDT